MRFLLDTHIFLFFINGDRSISKKTIDILNNKEAEKYISIISIWEITIKINIGKLKLKDDIDSIFVLLEKHEIVVLYPSQASLNYYLELPMLHKDPFDRLIIAQAITEDLSLITDDQHIRNYPNLKLF
ncbi:type II toxin-antitoxin system VapC family toxin [Pedobacter rhizosphaerae]|uniref:PIN domain nuclease, a component of toxin-antitoxin system (PIN domain) n=1 Tax=Pedobacter rhizosphaerae TaxID=390241 RepID=A0A1H9NR38_9SPHI|nr:type II toxin-antitoxin system VapC family toxin [Pedobacter rhizosphaerae]SER38089.1 PIN domain nuclease, a component of toxin-antitoxin system (PIN domain) [Pedobacter rhizosphaerae]